MDFFEAQARAKKRTGRLVLLFALAVFGTVAASYLAGSIGAGFAAPKYIRGFDRSGREIEASDSPHRWWAGGSGLAAAGVALAVIGLASLFKWQQFSTGGAAVAESVGARKLDPRSTDLKERRLLNVVEEMAIASGTPVPAVYVLADEPAINAFAAGLTTGDAVVAVTQGALDKLNRDELQGVIGHEFSHILNGDMRLNVRITALLFGILVLGLAGRGILWSLRGARFSSRGGKNSGGIIAAIVFVGLALLVIGYVGYFFGRLIQAAVSRQREYLADASAVQFTRNPAGLAGALRKIGGFALGSSLQTSKAAAIGHFFFAQSFRSGITGLWSTHPPLEERIRAIDPQWDGKMFEPPTQVDVARESFASAGLAPRRPVAPAPDLQPALQVAAAAVAAAGTLDAGNVAAAGAVLDALPPELRDAARDPHRAPVVVFALVLDVGTVGDRQRSLVRQRDGAAAAAALDALEPLVRPLPAEHKLPLVQLTLPAWRTLPRAQADAYLGTLDELVRADACVSTFEFTLQKLLTRTLTLARDPAAAVVQIYSFNAVVPEISTVLSALAHASSDDATAAAGAFSAGAAQLKLIAGQLAYVPAEACELPALGAALDKLAAASGPIKQRTLLAAAHVVSADGRITAREAELLRAIAATLDVPVPALAAT
jgi:Zn-dependent protease with chaperone function